MSTKQMQTCPDPHSNPQQSVITRTKQLGRGVVVAGLLAAVALTAMPATARAHGPSTGAAIGLGILGGVIAGAAIAATTTPPVYAAPPSYYYYPQQGYYYNTPAPSYYYNAPQPYYGSAAYSYPPYNYQ